MDKRAGLNLATDDVFVNVAGGLSVEEPAADLAIVASLASSLRNRAIPSDVVVFGEIGLAGEIRAIPHAALRVREAQQMGFRKCVMPDHSLSAGESPAHLEVVSVRTIGEALDALL
jgi:DNA repair protein RadA/Sms